MFNLFRRKHTYTCACCGETFTGSPSRAFLKPPFYFDVPEAEREARITIDSDLCHIRGETEDCDIFAIRVTLDIPIHGEDDPFTWGVWVTQSRANFERYRDSAGADRSSVTTFGWLPVVMPHYDRASTDGPFENLACDVHWGAEGLRPKIVLHESDHPLYLDQRDGISWDHAIAIVHPKSAN